MSEKVGAEDRLVKPVEDPVAEGVSLSAGIVMHAAARAHHHVGTFGQKRTDQFLRILRRIGAVAIGHDIDVRVDIGKHAAHHTPFALSALTRTTVRTREHGVAVLCRRWNYCRKQ